ncbi:MAG: 4Fe-4S binding protein [Kiritimatiellae bacterium]|nr:4Fe-4S binding protein [Kiritimatiellia bacterium]
MPWIKTEDCVGCGVCVSECPVQAIAMNEDVAQIDDQACIRCGKCHDICPQEAVRHDSERIPLEVEANVQWTKDLLRHFKSAEEQQGLVERMKRYFAKERKVAEQSIARLDGLLREIG